MGTIFKRYCLGAEPALSQIANKGINGQDQPQRERNRSDDNKHALDDVSHSFGDVLDAARPVRHRIIATDCVQVLG